MKRATNFSKKKSIHQSSFTIELIKTGDQYCIQPEIRELPKISFNGILDIFLTVWADNKQRRVYYCGTPDDIEIPIKPQFNDIDEGFTKKVYGVLYLATREGSCEIKAASKEFVIRKFHYDDEEEADEVSKKSLLRVDYDNNNELGHKPWTIIGLEESETMPTLRLNKEFQEVELKQKIASQHGTVQTLIITEAIQKILHHLIIKQGIKTMDMGDGWEKQWIKWATDTYLRDIPPNEDDEGQEWIDDFIDHYSNKQNLISKMKQDLRG